MSNSAIYKEASAQPTRHWEIKRAARSLQTLYTRDRSIYMFQLNPIEIYSDEKEEKDGVLCFNNEVQAVGSLFSRARKICCVTDCGMCLLKVLQSTT